MERWLSGRKHIPAKDAYPYGYRGFESHPFRIFFFLEECPSGLRSTLGKRVYAKVYRGFESHLLRHFLFLDSSLDRWGRALMQRREAQQARAEERRMRSLFEPDYLQERFLILILTGTQFDALPSFTYKVHSSSQHMANCAVKSITKYMAKFSSSSCNSCELATASSQGWFDDLLKEVFIYKVNLNQ